MMGAVVSRSPSRLARILSPIRRLPTYGKISARQGSGVPSWFNLKPRTGPNLAIGAALRERYAQKAHRERE